MLPDCEVLSEGHDSQKPAPAAEKVPASHVTQSDEDVAACDELYLPAVQLWHTVRPVLDVYVPG